MTPERPTTVMPPRPAGRGARAVWYMDLLARVSSGQRVVLSDQVTEVRDREAARAMTRDLDRESAPVPPTPVTPGSPFEVGGAVDAALHAYGLPPTTARVAAGACAMVWREIGRTDGPTRPCGSAADYVADLGYRGGARVPVCAGHAQQLVHAHRSREGVPVPVLHPVRAGVSFGLPPEYLGSAL